MADRRSVPLSVSILTLMALIVVPLSFTLSWLGWRGVHQMETEDVGQRMTALDDAVPVVGYNSDYLGALSLLFSIDDADQRREHQFVQLLWGAASRLSYRLGADDYPYAHS